jgi:hypothetical protein
MHKGVLDERPDGKIPLGKPRSRFKDNTKWATKK